MKSSLRALLPAALFAAVFSFAGAASVHAQENVRPAAPSADSPEPEKVVPEKDDGSGELDLSRFPGQVIDEVIVPVPSEIFSVLDKLGDPDWKSFVGKGKRPNFSERTDVALLLGSTVADGFVAVQAQDKQAVRDVGRDVLSLATTLGVRDDVLRHYQAIQDAADASDWDQVRQQLDATQVTVRAKMQQMQDGALAECVSVGGWLRGTEVVTAVIGKNWTRERAELLYQPDLADYFNDSLEEMMTKVSKGTKLKEIADGLARLKELMDGGGEIISARAVNEMHALSADLVRKITSKN